MLELTRDFGIGAQFGGRYFCHDVRVVRLPRHGASCPVAIAVSCSADRQALAKITPSGVWLERLETDPARFLPERRAGVRRGRRRRPQPADGRDPRAAVEVPGQDPAVADRAAGRGPRHRARQDRRAAGRGRADAGVPARPRRLLRRAGQDPEGYASGSFGPTTAGRMDSYVEKFQAAGGSLVMLAKGNRSTQVTRRVPGVRRLLPGLDRRPGRAAGAGLHPPRRGAGVPGARHGGGLADRGRGLPGVHRGRRQGQRLLRRGHEAGVDAGARSER